MNITVYGTATSSLQLIMRVISDILSKANIPYNLTEVNDVSIFLDKGIESVPAIQIDNDKILGLKSNNSFNRSLRAAVNDILRAQNYGDLAKIIVPTDFSDASINALIYGHRLATDVGAVTKALHVYQPESNLTKEEVSEKLSSLVATLNVDWASDILKASLTSKELRMGSPAQEILNSVEDNASELIVMGTTVAAGSKNNIQDSTSIHIATKAPCSVLLVPPKAKYTGCKKVLYIFQDFNEARKKIDAIPSFCQSIDCNIHILLINSADNAQASRLQKKMTNRNFSIQTKVDASTSLEEFQNLREYIKHQSPDIISIAHHNKEIFEPFFPDNIPTLILKA